MSPIRQRRNRRLSAIRSCALPSVAGLRSEIAVQVLKLAGYNPVVGVFYIAPHNWRDDIRPGVIYLQAPSAGTGCEGGATVGLWTFRKGKAEQAAVSVPDVLGLESELAVEKLTQAGLVSMSDSRLPAAPSQVEIRNVKWQYPSANQKVLPGTTVCLLPK